MNKVQVIKKMIEELEYAKKYEVENFGICAAFVRATNFNEFGNHRVEAIMLSEIPDLIRFIPPAKFRGYWWSSFPDGRFNYDVRISILKKILNEAAAVS